MNEAEYYDPFSGHSSTESPDQRPSLFKRFSGQTSAQREENRARATRHRGTSILFPSKQRTGTRARIDLPGLTIYLFDIRTSYTVGLCRSAAASMLQGRGFDPELVLLSVWVSNSFSGFRENTPVGGLVNLNLHEGVNECVFIVV